MRRKIRPGLSTVPGRDRPPQITDVTIEDAAMRSKSKGWLPCVVVTVITDDGAGLTGLLQADQAARLAASLVEAVERSGEDLRAAKADGTIR